jgi:hypothetical protein
VTQAAANMELQLDGKLVEDREQWRFNASDPQETEEGGLITMAEIMLNDKDNALSR